ncbi:ricin B lectin R40G3 [Trifolium repens]|nr:ricin B lectin R40G3 [Trifolium repens]
MEFPFNHGHNNNNNSSNVTHTHHNNRRDEEQQPHYPPPGHNNSNNFSPFNQPPPPPPHQPPFYADAYPPQPQPQPPYHHQQETQVFHTGHVSHQNFNHSSPAHPPPPPPPQPDIHSFNPNYGAYPPAPPSVPDHSSTPFPNSTVHHVSHETTHHPHFPTNVHHTNHEVQLPTAPPLSSNKPTFKVVTKASPNYSLTIRRGEVVLAPSDPSDQHQHWYKDEKWSTRVKDKEGHPAFALVNKVTGEAIKHSIAATHPVRLARYNPDYLDQSVLWTESKDQGSGYKAVITSSGRSLPTEYNRRYCDGFEDLLSISISLVDYGIICLSG